MARLAGLRIKPACWLESGDNYVDLFRLREGAGDTRRELGELISALEEQSQAARHIGSHVERVANAAEQFGAVARGSADTANMLLGVVTRLDGEVAHFRLA